MSDTHLLVSLDWQGKLHRIGHLEIHRGFVGKLKRAKKNKKPATTHKEIAELTENRISGSLFCRQFA